MPYEEARPRTSATDVTKAMVARHAALLGVSADHGLRYVPPALGG
jgi:hypothetical protein